MRLNSVSIVQIAAIYTQFAVITELLVMIIYPESLADITSHPDRAEVEILEGHIHSRLLMVLGFLGMAMFLG